MKFSELQRKLERAGWYIERTKKHHVYAHPDRPGVKLTVGKHGAREVPYGTMKNILKEAGLE